MNGPIGDTLTAGSGPPGWRRPRSAKHQADKIAEEWAKSEFGIKLAKTNQRGYDGVFPDGRKVEIKSKKYNAHSDSATYVDLSESKIEGKDSADCLLVIFVNYETGQVMDHICKNMDHVRKIAKVKTVYRITMSDLKK
ncbi:MAG: hypothetical protein OXD36_00940 [Rhodobacter sp.]|nr:hypothetical protein [Rhodobacter sp.]